MYWFEHEIQYLKTLKPKRSKNPRVVFCGDTSIKDWDLAYAFPSLNAVNMSFNGATLAAFSWYFEEILLPMKPKAILLHAGEHDLGTLRHSEEVVMFFQNFLYKTRLHFKRIPLVYLGVKPSPCHLDKLDAIRYTNRMIREEVRRQENCYFVDVFDEMFNERQFPDARYFRGDKQHFAHDGYELWKRELDRVFGQLFPRE